jgi:signal transduction histidine kinase
MSFFVLLWVDSSYFGTIVTSSSLSVILYKLNGVAVLLFLFSFYYFFVDKFLKAKRNKIIDTLILIGVIICSFVTLFTNKIIISAKGQNIIFGSLSLFFYIFALIVSLIILYFGFKEYSSLNRRERQRVIFFFIGIIIFIIANIIFNILIPFLFNTSEYQNFGDFSVIFFLGFTAYAIVKHHLFDIRFAIIRSVTYSLVLAALAGIYLIIAFIFSALFSKELNSPYQIISGVVISLVLAFVFQPLRRFFDKVTNKIFYKDGYNTDDFFARLNESLTVTTDLRNLLEKAAFEIGRTLKSEQVFFFINTSDGHYVSAGTPNHIQLPKSDAAKIGEFSQKVHGLIITSTLDVSDPIRRLMLSHRIEIILPLDQDNRIIGYLCLGDRLTSDYTNRDIKVVSAVSDELIIAIQNALAVHEIRELNVNLQQRIANATKELRISNTMLRHLDRSKDEFVSMASHQLRTPLTSVKGYISMVLEGDAGRISDSQRQLLGEAFSSSERMVRLIDDFLNVSRIQTGKFVIDKHPIDLSKLVEQEIDSLGSSALVRNMKFVYNPPRNFPIINVDESKIRQVVMNFADNAIYYSTDNSDININLSIEGDNAVFTVKDTGIGVPRDEQDQLFTKFYRASNAKKQRPDGTGVGLYLAKKIINAHDGRVIFESSQGKGSTFGFSLPIKQV